MRDRVSDIARRWNAAGGLLRRFARLLVSVEPDFDQQVSLERRLVYIRWLGIAFVAPSLPLFGLEPTRMLGAYLVLAFAALYNLVILVVLKRAPRRVANGFLPVLADGLANAGFVLLVGGFDSPAYFLLFTVTISAAMRYGYGPSLAAASIFGLLDFAEQSFNLAGVAAPGSDFIIRNGVLAHHGRPLGLSARARDGGAAPAGAATSRD